MQIRINLKVVNDQLFVEADGTFLDIAGKMRTVVILKVVERWDDIMLLTKRALTDFAESHRFMH